MKQVLILLLSLFLVTACGQEEAPQAPVEEQPVTETEATEPATDDPVEELAAEETLEVVEESAAVEEEPADEAIVLAMADETPAPAREWQYKEGQHYSRLVPTQPTMGGADKIEVAELFMYGCPACNSVDPHFSSWASEVDPGVRVVRIPVMFNRIAQVHAQLYFTAELLATSGQLADWSAFHKAVFAEFHQRGNRLTSMDSIERLFGRFGVSADDFNKTWNSFPVNQKMRLAADLSRRYGVGSVPAFVVAGKYRTSVAEAGSLNDLFGVFEELLAREGLN
jgi:thiol:disulfide interchange protein DsbA